MIPNLPTFLVLWNKKIWTRNILSEVLDVLVVASKKPVPYSIILSLDRKLRDDMSLKSKNVFAQSSSMDAQFTGPILASLQFIVNLLIQETSKRSWLIRSYITHILYQLLIALLLIHRLPLTRALHGPLQNVFGSKYGPSVLASYRSACHIVLLHQKLASLGSALPFRLWFLWNHLLGAAVIHLIMRTAAEPYT